MTRRIYTASQDGFVGASYGGPAGSRKAVILMPVGSSSDRMAPYGASAG